MLGQHGRMNRVQVAMPKLTGGVEWSALPH